MKYQLVIVNRETREVVQWFEPHTSMRMVEKVQRGVNINLNHELYYSEVRPYNQNQNNQGEVF